MIYLYFAAFIVSFAILYKSADLFVDGASGIARVLKLSKMLVGILIVGMATTAPEFCVSVIASIMGKPEIALGNAVGSVICDDGIALALAAILAPAVIMINCRILKIVGIFLLAIDFLAYFLARNGTIGRLEGAVLVLILCIYYIVIIKRKDLRFGENRHNNRSSTEKKDDFSPERRRQLKRPVLLFIIGLAGVIISSFIIVEAAKNIARYFSISDIVIAATVVAIGTSLPEISTCIAAALKGEGQIAVGNIIGADVLNVLWIIGVASIANPITVELKIMNFTFPFMILIVATMLVAMRIGCRVGKIKGLILLGLYLIYLTLTLILFT
ncbi:MAG: calcium/sodium antiporter [Candidatus Aminicenantes bacterium]|nr:MAG: calcium/sodium antiporter [Candidatus Aminicenantes bacterium]